MALQLVLIRHATTAENSQNKFIGTSDVDLSPEGYSQAARLKNVLSDMKQSVCFASPLKRVVETTRLALDSNTIHFELDPDLREINFGGFENLTFNEVAKRFPEHVNAWAKFEPGFSFPDGERMSDFFARIKRIGEKLSSNEAESVVAFTHGGVIRALICYFLGLDPTHYILFDISPASVTTLRIFDGKGVLACLNDTSHLRGCSNG